MAESQAIKMSIAEGTFILQPAEEEGLVLSREDQQRLNRNMTIPEVKQIALMLLQLYLQKQVKQGFMRLTDLLGWQLSYELKENKKELILHLVEIPASELDEDQSWEEEPVTETRWVN